MSLLIATKQKETFPNESRGARQASLSFYFLPLLPDKKAKNEMSIDLPEIQSGVLPYDFPRLGLRAGDTLHYEVLKPGQPVPENVPVIARSVDTNDDDETVGYVVGDTLHLVDQSIPRYHDWGAVVVGRVRTMFRAMAGQEEGQS